MTPQQPFGPGNFAPPPAPSQDLANASIGLMVSAGLGFLAGGFAVLNALLSFAGRSGGFGSRQGLPPALAPLMKAMESGALTLVSALVMLGVNAVILFAALQMRQMKNHTLGIVGAGLCCVPCCFHSCCSLVVLPIGIWVLMTLLKPEIKAQFSS